MNGEKDDFNEDKHSFQIENNPLFQGDIEIPFKALSEKLSGLTYLPYSCTTMGLPFLWPLDIITWIDKDGKNIPSLITHATHIINGRTTLKAVGETETKSGYSRSDPVTKPMVTWAEAEYVKTKIFLSEIANINKLYAGEIEALWADIKNIRTDDLEAVTARLIELSAVTAELETLLADKAAIEELKAAEAEIDKAIVDIGKINTALIKKAEITDLEAAAANIGTLTALVSNINTLLSGATVSGSTQTIVLTAQNATLDDALIKNGIAAKMSIGDLQAGKISTNRFKIGSDDDTVKITDSTLQISDGNQVRVQIGRDASGDHNIYVWDQEGKLLFDAGGLTKAGAGRPIITDLSVADDANISGDKLNINSVVEEVNNSSSTIKSSHIAFDETGQTLDVAFGSVETSVEEIKRKKMYRLAISSSNGDIFKNGDIDTVLSAHVYSWDEDVTGELDENQFIWTRVSNDPEDDKKWNAAHFGGTKQIAVTSNDVKVRATFFCDLQDTATRKSLLE